jgi:phospholipid/cholesterol/gamma-HCH transport system permease protein
MGLGPMPLLVVPRLFAIIITLPLLTFFADIMGLVGGAIIAHAQLGIAPMPYVERLRVAVDTKDLLVGLVKAPIFAFIIGAIGCMHGLRVAGSAESVGRETTRAVVKAIFLVIILDALFSVFFERVGW